MGKAAKTNLSRLEVVEQIGIFENFLKVSSEKQ